MSPVLGDWVWSVGDHTLRFDIQAGPYKEALNGRWSLEDFGRALDGLSLRRLREALRDADQGLACDLTLADGRLVQLAGGATPGGETRGVVLGGAAAEPEDGPPRPGLRPVYQPIFNLGTGRIDGFEALARWAGEDRRRDASGPRSDDRALAANMLIRACEALARWQAASGRPELFVQVNLTSQDLDDPSLVDLVSALIGGFGLADGCLRLELTEQAALRDSRAALAMAQALERAGAHLVLDDFGSGHSSFLWLADLPARSLKVDASLIAQIGRDRVRLILEEVVRLGHRLGLTVTAEGVEDQAVLPDLRQLGFEFAQGFGLSHPLDADEALRRLMVRTGPDAGLSGEPTDTGSGRMSQIDHER